MAKEKKSLKKKLKIELKGDDLENCSKLPSLRNIDDESEDDNFIEDLELQSCIAKTLANTIEKELSATLLTNTAAKSPKIKYEGGIKLFTESKKCVKITKHKELPMPMKRVKIKKRQLENDLLDNKTKCALVAVEASDILSQNDVKSWSNRSKAEIFNYKKGKKGKLVLIEPSFVSIQY